MYRVELKVYKLLSKFFAKSMFLMYRVELKAVKKCHAPRPAPKVPNVPCGVESRNQAGLQPDSPRGKFLMYRVELKVEIDNSVQFYYLAFLMYRVELKGALSNWS